jgi:DNA-binding NarL/FixJ family response regulator
MTTKHRKHLDGIFAPKQLFADNRYSVDTLDNARLEVLPRYHRDAAADDPWLAPAKSEAVRALLILIGAAQNHSTATNYPVELDLQAFCQDAKLKPAETEVVLLAAEGWVQRQIGEWLEINQATVSRRLSSGRRKLSGWLPVLVAIRLQNA